MTQDASKESNPADLDDPRSDAIHAADEIREAAARKAEELKESPANRSRIPGKSSMNYEGKASVTSGKILPSPF